MASTTPKAFVTAEYNQDAEQIFDPNLNSIITANRIKNTLGVIDNQSYLGRVTTLRIPSIASAVLRAYRQAIIAGGSTISDATLEALLPSLERLVQSTAWPKLRELWIPAGTDLTAALYKIKADSTAGAAMTGISLVAGDYNPSQGITGNGSSKAINTGFNPTTAGVAANDWGFGVFIHNNTHSGILAGTLVNTGTYLAYASSNTTNFNQQSAGTQYPMNNWNAVQLTGGRLYKYNGAFVQASSVLGTGTLDNTSFTLLAANSSFWSSDTISGWAAWSPGLTQEEMREVTLFFSSANTALWRNNWQAALVACGDSNTTGFGLGSPSTQRWSKLLASRLGLTEDNQGANDTTMSDNDNGTAAGHWVDNIDRYLYTTINRAPTIMTVALGTNDDRYQVSTTNFNSDYETWLNIQFSGGIDPSQMILCSPVAATDVLSSRTRQQAFGRIIQQLATKYGTGYFDLFGLTVGQTSYFQGDNLHLSTTGHTAIATAIGNYITTLNKPGVLRRVGW